MSEHQLGDAKEAVQESVNGGSGSSGLSKLLSKDIIVPVAATAVTAAAAGLAVTKGPGLKDKLTNGPGLKDKLANQAREQAQELGREGAEGAKEAITGGGGPLGTLAAGASKLIPGKGKGKGGPKKTRRLPIQRWTDVAVPVERAYEQWTKFDEFPKFMHRVVSVEQKEDDLVEWQEKIWFSKRQWQGEITDRRENDRIAWKTVSGTSHTGLVSFHRLDDNLTRVLVTVDFQPAGMLEKMASGLRFAKRAVQADLARFKAYVELEDAEGVEYESVPAAQEKQQENEGGDEENKGGDDEGDEQQQEQRASRNGSGADDDEREEERKEREQRRQERRETASTSS